MRPEGKMPFAGFISVLVGPLLFHLLCTKLKPDFVDFLEHCVSY